jgi:hypothetical protein
VVCPRHRVFESGSTPGDAIFLRSFLYYFCRKLKMNQKLVDLVVKLVIAARNARIARMHERQAKRTHHTLFSEKKIVFLNFIPKYFFHF